MLDREQLAAQIMCAHVRDGAVGFETCFELADRFLAYAAKQREPKACDPELEFDRNDIGGKYMVKCNHAHTNSTFTTGLPPKKISRVCTLCGISVLPDPPKPERDISKCNHLWVSDGGECYYCQWCKIPKVNVDKQKVKPEPPKPERGAREFNLYKFADGELRAFPSDQATVVYAGFTAPIFICTTREILPGDEG